VKHNFIDLTGKTFGTLTVLALGDNLKGHWNWECRCECGTVKKIRGIDLRRGTAKSCGCAQRQLARNLLTKHGGFGTPEYDVWVAAKYRAKRLGVLFDLDLRDVVIPDKCPVLGIPLTSSTSGKAVASSPSLDRMIPEKGYVRGNVFVISYRANVLKNDATLDEIKAIVTYLEGVDETK